MPSTVADLRSASRGNRRAIDDLLRRLEVGVRRGARLKCRDQGGVDSSLIAAKTLVIVSNDLSKGKIQAGTLASLRAYAATALHRIAVKAFRQKPARSADYSVSEVAAPTEDEPSSVAQKVEERRTLWRFLGGLPRDERVAVQRRFLDDYSYDEIGAELQMGKDTARRRVQDGLARLRGRYEARVLPFGPRPHSDRRTRVD